MNTNGNKTGGAYMNNAKPTPRRITLNLTDNEVKGLTAFAIRGGVTVGTLLEDFVADLTYSTRSGGSDEEDRARAWYDRRGYQYGEGRSFSAYLAEYDDGRRFFSDLEDYETLIKERDYLTAHPDETEPGELESVIDDAVIAREALEEYLSDYRRENPEATLETIIADAKAHENELKDHRREVLESDPTEEEPRSAGREHLQGVPGRQDTAEDTRRDYSGAEAGIIRHCGGVEGMTHTENIVSYIGTIWDFIQGKNEAEIREIILQDAQMQERPEWLLANVDEIAREAAREVEA